MNFIAGEWVAGNNAVVDLNPSDLNDRIGDFAQADREQVGAAVDAARSARRSWRDTGIHRRAEILDAIGSEILAGRQALGTLLSREEGKTLAEGIAEVERAGHIFKFFAGEAVRVSGTRIDSVRPGVDVEVMRDPVGVVGIITPWNFPIAIPAWKIAPALAFGNTVVFKPAGLVPATAQALTKIIVGTELPAGVFNLVMGPGREVGRTIADSPHVDAVSFTGSVAVGRSILVETAQRQARVQLEMGGKNPLLVLDDADLENAVQCAVNGAFFSTGQRCTASSRLIVTEGIHDQFVDRLAERMKSLKVGHALNPDTQIGPVVDETQLGKNLEYVEIGCAEGARLMIGGKTIERDTRGYYFAPALFTETNNTMRINREEIFGPIASIIRVTDFEEALDVANDSDLGLSAGICTTSLKHASHFRRYSNAGMVMVNLPTAGVDYHVPFGGRKSSSFGPREQGQAAVEFYTTTKTSYVKP